MQDTGIRDGGEQIGTFIGLSHAVKSCVYDEGCGDDALPSRGALVLPRCAARGGGDCPAGDDRPAGDGEAAQAGDGEAAQACAARRRQHARC